MTFPISVVTMRPSSSFFPRKIRAASRRISPRRGAGVFRHLSNAPFAARTASPNSSFVAEGNVARTSPVAGLIVSNRFPSDFFHFPPMKRPYSWTIEVPLPVKRRPSAKTLVSPPAVRSRGAWPRSASSRKGVTTIRTLRDATIRGDPAATLRARPRGARRRPGRDEEDEPQGTARENQSSCIRKESWRVASPVIGEQDREGHNHKRDDHAGSPGSLGTEARMRGTRRPTASDPERGDGEEDRDQKDDLERGPK